MQDDSKPTEFNIDVKDTSDIPPIFEPFEIKRTDYIAFYHTRMASWSFMRVDELEAIHFASPLPFVCVQKGVKLSTTPSTACMSVLPFNTLRLTDS